MAGLRGHVHQHRSGQEPSGQGDVVATAPARAGIIPARPPESAALSTDISPPTGPRLRADTRALTVEDLLPQDVCVPAVLGEFAQYVEVRPAQRERAAPVAVDPVV
jgi:hypothetical protein